MTEFVIRLDGLGKDVAWHTEIYAECPKCRTGRMPLEGQPASGTSLICPSCHHQETLAADRDEILAKILSRAQQVHQTSRPKAKTARAPYT